MAVGSFSHIWCSHEWFIWYIYIYMYVFYLVSTWLLWFGFCNLCRFGWYATAFFWVIKVRSINGVRRAALRAPRVVRAQSDTDFCVPSADMPLIRGAGLGLGLCAHMYVQE